MGLLSRVGKSIRAYHGSPHDFDRFELSDRTIGTGEGAQVYGHGLYFAENEGVARSYKNAGRAPYQGPQVEMTAKEALDASGGDRAKALALLHERMMEAKDTGNTWEYRVFQDAVNNFDEVADRLPGRMYEVDINADPEDFLDWDAPLSQSPDAIAKLEAAWRAGGAPDPIVQPTWSGRQEYEELVGIHGQARASQLMRDAGVPGIRFLDQGSRGSGDGTRNFVVFDDSLVEILRKYGIPISALTGGGLLSRVGGGTESTGE